MKKHIAVLLLMTQLLLYSGCTKADESSVKNNNQAKKNETYIIGSGKAARAVSDAIQKAGVAWDPIHRGTDYYERGQYDLAIENYKNAIKLSSNNGQEGVARTGLSRAYEAKGDYELALKELSWLMSRKVRPDVMEKYTAHKHRLEKLLAEKNSK